jgi:dimethylhistidine N-methyltransferase
MSQAATLRRPGAENSFAMEVSSGLGLEQKAISSTWLYDQRGSELFEEITELAEYYPTRSELALFRDHLPAFGAAFGRHASVIEIGAGSSRKTRLLLQALRSPYAYFPIDISADFLFEAVGRLQEEFPQVRCTPVVADFTDAAALAAVARRLSTVGPALGFFPGSTLGNFEPHAAQRLLGQLAHALGDKGALVIGIDSTADPDVLLPAYDDARGVTAAFNLNLLARINRELGGTFRLDTFAHEARFDAMHSRIEMHLVSRIAQRVLVLGKTYFFQAGETIHTENSHKFSRTHFLEMARAAGWISQEVWSHHTSGFEVHVLGRSAAIPKVLSQGD